MADREHIEVIEERGSRIRGRHVRLVILATPVVSFLSYVLTDPQLPEWLDDFLVQAMAISVFACAILTEVLEFWGRKLRLWDWIACSLNVLAKAVVIAGTICIGILAIHLLK